MNLKLNLEVLSSNHIYMYLFLIGPLSGIAYMTEVTIIYEPFTIVQVPCILAGGEENFQGIMELSGIAHVYVTVLLWAQASAIL